MTDSAKNLERLVTGALKVVLYLVCLCLFVSLMYQTWDNFSQELTTVGEKSLKDPNYGPYLPSISICPWKSFRKPGFFYKQIDYDANTYKLSEIFYLE